MKKCRHNLFVNECSSCIIDDLTKQLETVTKQRDNFENWLNSANTKLDSQIKDLDYWKSRTLKTEEALLTARERKDEVIKALYSLDLPEQPRKGLKWG